MSAVQRIDVPSGTVPPLKDFMRHVWRYRDESGQTVIVSPPGDVLTMVIDDQNEADIAMVAVQCLAGTLGFEGRITARFRGPCVLIGFRDLPTVHMFFSVLSMQADRAPAREIASFWLSMLGFRWT